MFTVAAKEPDDTNKIITYPAKRPPLVATAKIASVSSGSYAIYF